MYSKCSTKLNTIETKKVLDYINYEEYKIEDEEQSELYSDERDDEIDKIFYNIDRLDKQTTVIYRNYNAKASDREVILKIKKYCKKKGIKFYLFIH